MQKGIRLKHGMYFGIVMDKLESIPIPTTSYHSVEIDICLLLQSQKDKSPEIP